MTQQDTDDRLAVFLDYENLAIGARESIGEPFDFGPVADALAERGRVIARKAYADWSYFDDDRRMLTRHQVELVDIPQKMGGSRKNAADIKMAIDAVELALDRSYLSTFVICTGDSDLSPLVQKLRELDRRVIGVGVRQSTSRLLPPACDEFLFYDDLVPDRGPTGDVPVGDTGVQLVLSTLAGLTTSADSVRASALKRAVLRKDPTFNEAVLGFRSFGALLAALSRDDRVELEGKGDPQVSVGAGSSEAAADGTLLAALTAAGGSGIPLSGLKTAMRKVDSDFSESRLGFRNFGAYVRAAEARSVVAIEGDGDERTVHAL